MKRGLGGDWPGKMEQMLGSFQVLGSLKFPKIDLTQVLKNRWLKFGAGGEGQVQSYSIITVLGEVEANNINNKSWTLEDCRLMQFPSCHRVDEKTKSWLGWSVLTEWALTPEWAAHLVSGAD